MAGRYGLEVNSRKSQGLIFNMRAEVEEIGGFVVVDEIRYMGGEN